MGPRVAAAQVLGWTLRTVTSSICSPLPVGRRGLGPPCSRCPSFYSSSSSSSSSSNATPPPAGELPSRSLQDLGFTEAEWEHIYDLASRARGRGNAAAAAATKQQVTPTLTALLMLGLKPSKVITVLEKCPELYVVRELQPRIVRLRKLGVVDGSLQRLVAWHPRILTIPLRRLNAVVSFLRDKCLFTAQQVVLILQDSPAIVERDLEQLEYMFQYVYFRMGVKQVEMVKSRLFRFTLDELRCRHTFLARRGFYQTPDKKGQTSIANPKLERVLSSDEEFFLASVAKASAEEYDVFRRLIKREWQDEEEQHGEIEADSDSEDELEDNNNEEEEDGEEEEEEPTDKESYRKKRNKD